MLRATENEIKTELQQVIRAWIEETEVRLPYLGENISEIMANAAVQVLLGIADTQEYLEQENLLTD